MKNSEREQSIALDRSRESPGVVKNVHAALPFFG